MNCCQFYTGSALNHVPQSVLVTTMALNVRQYAIIVEVSPVESVNCIFSMETNLTGVIQVSSSDAIILTIRRTFLAYFMYTIVSKLAIIG